MNIRVFFSSSEGGAGWVQRNFMAFCGYESAVAGRIGEVEIRMLMMRA